MYKFFQWVMDGLRRGENIDLIVTAALALTTTALSTSNAKCDTLVPTLTLTTLSMISINMLINRYRIDRVNLKRSNILVFLNQDEANDFIVNRIKALRNINEAKIIQYSSDYIQPVIQFLLRNKIRTELMLQNPDKAYDELQRNKITTRLKDYDVVDLSKKAQDSNEFTILLYNDIASIRAIKLDNEICIGYYSYTGRVHGHTNFACYFPSSNPFTPSVIAQFNKTFEALRMDSISPVLPSSIPLREAVPSPELPSS